MTIRGGGTFLPRHLTLRHDANLIANALFTERKYVLLKLQHFGGHKESYTLITPLHAYKHYNFGVRVNSYTGYTLPVNRFMHEYIFLGIIPKHVAAQRTIQVFTSNGHRVQFKNCDGNPNGLFAFLPNRRHQTPSPYHASNLWRSNTAKIQTLPFTHAYHHSLVTFKYSVETSKPSFLTFMSGV